MNKSRTAIGAVTLAALLTLTACGSDDSDGGDTATDTDTSSAPSGGPGGFDTEQLDEIQKCLKAAGLEDKFPTGQPSGVPSDVPSDFPTDMPSDLPSDLPSDFPTDLGSDGPGSGAGVFQDPEVQQALEACGIDLPQAPGQS